MGKTVYHDGDEGVELIVTEDEKKKKSKKQAAPAFSERSPVHVVYGGAHLFRFDTAQKLGRIALDSIRMYAPNFAEFARAMNLPGTETLPGFPKVAEDLGKQIAKNEPAAKREVPGTWLAWTLYTRTLEKLEREPVEDLRIDFEDGYGFRPDNEEDADAAAAAGELAKAIVAGTLPEFCGIRIKAFGKETLHRAARTLDIFMAEMLKQTRGELPPNFVVTLPKVTDRKHVRQLCERLKEIEKQHKLAKGAIRIEIVIESPLAIFDKKGRSAMKGIVAAAKGRCVAAHFGAYDYTSAVGISGRHQDLRHPSCDFARQMMLAALSPMKIRLADSVTATMPLPIHKKPKLTEGEKLENKRAVHSGWRIHFANVSASMAEGFYQSWDLHPNQLVARYAAVLAFYMQANEAQAARLKAFIENATKAGLTGNTFDDAASAQGLINFFRNALDRGALTEDEVTASTGLTPAEIRTGSFAAIMESRRNG